MLYFLSTNVTYNSPILVFLVSWLGEMSRGVEIDNLESSRFLDLMLFFGSGGGICGYKCSLEGVL